jgi:hypothetical protein
MFLFVATARLGLSFTSAFREGTTRALFSVSEYLTISSLAPVYRPSEAQDISFI